MMVIALCDYKSGRTTLRCDAGYKSDMVGGRVVQQQDIPYPHILRRNIREDGIRVAMNVYS